MNQLKNQLKSLYEYLFNNILITDNMKPEI